MHISLKFMFLSTGPQNGYYDVFICEMEDGLWDLYDFNTM